MDNQKKRWLRADVLDYKKRGFSKKATIQILSNDFEYTASTVRKYWEVFCEEKETK